MPQDVMTFVIFLVALMIALVLTFFLSLSISLVAFWTSEVWAPRFLITSIASLVSGLLFPLDILPHRVYQVLMYTPFPYMIYVPIKLYLHAESTWATGEIWFFTVIGLIWCSLFFLLSLTLWKKGMKEFSFYGR
jgi:ABC-2 type transport system permease protein